LHLFIIGICNADVCILLCLFEAKLNIVRDLNEEQRTVVVNTEGPALVMAGPGSGKTRVLTYRIAYLIENRGVEPHRILAVTFTNKAAREMKERIAALLPGLKEYPWISTFHSFCLRLLRETTGRGLRSVPANFVIYDDDDSLRLIKSVIRDLQFDDQLFKPAAVAACIGMAKSRLEDPELFQSRVSSSYEEAVAKVYSLYQEELHKKGALDFDDLIMKAELTLKTYPAILSSYRSKFRYLLVDEFQDTNIAQFRIVKLLAEEHRNIFVVGDEDQSIYSWRGASPDNIKRFETDFPEHRFFTLGGNFRSTGNIVRASSQLIMGNRDRKEKTHWTNNPHGESVIYNKLGSDYDEAGFIAETIGRIREKYPLRSIAVLYRTNAQSRLIEEQLLNSAIPYVIVGGLKFYQRREVRDIIAYYRFILNPNDDSALERIINVPKRGIGEKTIQQLRALADAGNITMGALISDSGDISSLTAAAQQKIGQFRDSILRLRATVENSSPSGLLKEIIIEVNYLKYLEEDSGTDSEGRVDNLEQLISAAAFFRQENPESTLVDYLDHISLLSELDEYKPSDTVTLMTIHNAKGLEFDVVFLAGLEENLLPHVRSLESEAAIEEERRLCFVAMTRAAKLLYLLNAKKRMSADRVIENPPSRFLSSIDGSLLSNPSGNGYEQPPYSPVKNTSPLKIGSNLDNIMQFFKDRNIETGDFLQNAPAMQEQSSLRNGSRVRHPVFGTGIVYSVEGRGKSRKARIYFQTEGYKTMMLEYADLQILD
jgi:DNA helicase-2/ATP-dependent DNA helicase PcrA